MISENEAVKGARVRIISKSIGTSFQVFVPNNEGTIDRVEKNSVCGGKTVVFINGFAFLPKDLELIK